jgi:hypothetical protein
MLTDPRLPGGLDFGHNGSGPLAMACQTSSGVPGGGFVVILRNEFRDGLGEFVGECGQSPPPDRRQLGW